MKSSLKWIVLAGVLANLVCSNNVGASQTLRLGIDATGSGAFDPHCAATDADRIIADMLFNGLIRYQPGNFPTIEPDLAEDVPKPKMVEGKQCWTFVLRKGVRFHPGPQGETAELTADDVIYSLQKAADPTRSAYASLYAGMIFKRLDDYTLQVVVDKPLSSVLFLPRFTTAVGGAVLCRRAVEERGETAFKLWPVGTGPFLFAGYMAGKKVTLLAHTNYFRGAPRIEGVEVFFLPDGKEREHGLRTGALDVICGIRSSEWVSRASQWERIHVDAFGPGETAAIRLHSISPPMQRKAVRQAIAYALTRGDFSAGYGKTLAEESCTPVPAFVPGGMSNTEVKGLGQDYATDHAKARRLLGEAGYSKGCSVRVAKPVDADAHMIVEIMRKRLKQIDVKVKAIDKSDRTAPDMQPLIFRMTGLATAEDFFPRFFQATYPKIDTLIDAAHNETSPKKQSDLWRYIQMKVLDDMVIYPICTINYVYARNAGVEYGHALIRTGAPYPQFTEQTRLVSVKE